MFARCHPRRPHWPTTHPLHTFQRPLVIITITNITNITDIIITIVIILFIIFITNNTLSKWPI